MFSHIDKVNRAFRKMVAGLDGKVPTLGRHRRYIHFDNAASTPPLKPVLEDIRNMMNWYSGVHRGTGYKSLLSSKLYDESHDVIGNFVNADLAYHTVILLKNTTEAINKLSYRLRLDPRDIVLATAMEHHSNDLPWRARSRVEYGKLNEKGQLDINDIQFKLKKYYPRVKLLAVCGASNVTGHINDIYKLAGMAHDYGAALLVDGAQLVPHRPFDMKAPSDPCHIDFLAFSGHKIYAPFGSGVLIGPRKVFAEGDPEYSGGGTVSMVMKNRVYWADPPDKEEAGSPNVTGAYALARTLQLLKRIGMEKLAQYEEGLNRYLLNRLCGIKNLTVYGAEPRVGVVSFNISGMPHSLVGAILCYEAGIGVRTGCFCAQNYVRFLLGVEENPAYLQQYEEKQQDVIPGMVRVSLAAYNSREEIDILLKWLTNIASNREHFKKQYVYSVSHGGFIPNVYHTEAAINKLCQNFW